MSKKKFISILAILLIITNITTFALTNLISVSFNNKAYVPLQEYNKLKAVYDEHAKVNALKSYVKKNYLRDIDEEKMLEGQLKGVVYSLEDPYSAYMTQDEFKDLMEQTSGSFGGIGVVITPGEDNLITVVSPIADTPGERAGIKSGDKIIKVDGKEFMAENMDQATKAMKGEPGTDVVLTIMRIQEGKENKVIDLDITREIITLETIEGQVLEDNIGYINISSFDDNTHRDFKKELDRLGEEGIEGLIIDVRNNPGGLLSRTVQIADELLGDADIVYTQTKDGKKQYQRSNKKMVDYPLVILMNGGSASASEILAGAIKDNERGLLIGTTSFGKGVVQRIHDFPDGTGVRLTISEYFTPKGINIHGVGIEPDILVELDEDVEIIGLGNIQGDNQLQRAIKELKDRLK